jgi:undecaprenyl-diphosphatase
MINFLFIVGAKYVIILSVLIGAWWFYTLTRNRKERIFFFTLFTCILAIAIAKLGSNFYFDPRPFVEQNFTPLIPHNADNGFPSDHALLAGAAASIVSFYDKRKGLYLWLIAFFVGLSRIFVGVHHITDILASFLIAFISALIIFFVQRKYWDDILKHIK